jgi:hypothetical protein
MPPRSSITFGVPIASADGRYYARYPRGNRPFATGAGATAAASAATGSALGGDGGGGGGGGPYYGGPVLGNLTPTIYAAPTAQGSGNGSSEANATTLASALSSATAGAIIGVLPGVYSRAGGAERYSPAWRATNSGTSSNPIIVVAKYSAIDLAGKAAGQAWTSSDFTAVFAHSNRSELRHTGSSSNGGGTGGPAFGSIDVNYVHWIGFCADEQNAAPHRDTGLAILWSTTGSKVMRCVLYARDPGYTSDTGDNHPNVRLEFATNCTVSDNALSGSFAGNGLNHCCVQRYRATGTIVEHNFTAGLYNGIFLKDEPNTSWNEIVRFNYCANPTYGIYIRNCNEGRADLDRVYQNLLVGCSEPIVLQIDGYNVQVDNNTVVAPMTNFGGSQGVIAYFQGTGCRFQNNIFVGTLGSAFIDQQFRSAAVTPSNYNRFWRTGTAFGARYNGSTYSAIANWRTATGQDVNSTIGDPLFVNQAGGNYRLQAGSPCLTLSSTSGPVGCYITGNETIGPRYAA